MEFGRVTAHVRNPNTRAGRLLYGSVSGAAALALAASGCGGSSSKGLTDPAPAPAKAGSSKPSEAKPAKPELVFDDLGGGSSIIRVYPGPNADPDDWNGTFNAGDEALALCDAEGRPVQSDPGAGETPRHSDEWVKIHGTPGLPQFATAVYAEHPQQLLKQLPEC